MRMEFGPRGMVGLGFILLVTGVVLPFLMMIQVIEPTFFLGFLSYFSSMIGLILGTIGTALYVRRDRHEEY
jgi:hypothetical protein